MNKVNPGHSNVIPFTENTAHSSLRGYGFRIKRRGELNGKVLEIDVFSTRTSSAWTKMMPNSAGGYTLGGVYSSKRHLLILAQSRVEQIECRNARAAAASSVSKTTLINQAIVFSDSKGVSQMFKAGTTLDEVVEVLEKRSIEIDSSFKVFYPKTGLVKNLVAVPQKVVLRFE